MQLPEAFDTFHERVSLNKTAHDKIQTAAGGLIAYLAGAYGVPQRRVFAQGSYANGTAVEPEDSETGEYDVDLVCDAMRPGMTADEALADVERTLSANGTYRKLLRGDESRKTPCVRLFYAPDDVGAFHVDIVPARASTSTTSTAPLEVPRRGAGWHDTAPAEYTEWCRSQGERFARTVRMLKRWREVNQDARLSIKSIVLQVLAANNLGSERSDAEALVSTLRGIQNKLADSPDGPPVVPNPVLPEENLAARWTKASYADFRKELDRSLDLAHQALTSTSTNESHALWRRLLGADFPPPGPGAEPKRVPFVPVTPPPRQHERPTAPPRERYGG